MLRQWRDPLVGFVEAFVTGRGAILSEDGEGRLPSPRLDELIFQELPRLTYIPIVDEPLVLIRAPMLQEFELLDAGFGSFACALNDFALRANRCGYRVVQANHARVARTLANAPAWESDMAATEHDEEILRCRFPHLEGELRRYRRSSDRMARKLLRGLRPDADGRLKIVFACDNLAAIHNGTSELARQIIGEFSTSYSDKYMVYILCSADAFVFHKYPDLKGITRLDTGSAEVEGPFFASIRLVQPFYDGDIARLANQAPISMVLIRHDRHGLHADQSAGSQHVAAHAQMRARARLHQ